MTAVTDPQPVVWIDGDPLMEAIAAAVYREARGLPEDAVLAGDALWFHVRDDEVVIEFAVEVPQ